VSTSTVAGFVIAPLVPVTIMGAINPPTGQHDLGLFFLIAAIIYVNAGVFMLIFGIPTYLLLRRWGVMRWWSVAMVGLAVGAFVGGVYRLPFYPSCGQSVLIQGFACALAGIAFWLVWRLGDEPAEQAPSC